MAMPNFNAAPVQGLMPQGTAPMTSNLNNQYASMGFLPQVNHPAQMGAMSDLNQPSTQTNMTALITEMMTKAKAGLLTPVQLAQVRNQRLP